MKPIEEFLNTVAKLRTDCPWDREQTHKSLKRYLIEETYETIDAIDSDNPKALMEELGDVLLQVVLHAQIASESNQFSFDDLVSYINKKMISRHPHVFSDVSLKTKEEVMVNWEKLKKEEKPNRKKILDGVPNSLPALLKAFKVSKKASKEGFKWEDKESLWRSFKKELNEFEEAAKSSNEEKFKEELGDLIFMLVNIASWYKVDPEDSLNVGIKKFVRRYKKVKKLASKNLDRISSNELNNLWERVKNDERGI